MEVVINACYGGFGLSHEAVMAYAERKKIALYTERTSFGHTYFLDQAREECFAPDDIDRHDPDLVAVVRDLGGKASGRYADLKIVEIPDETDYVIEEYDGFEHVAEKHETWS